MTETLILFSLGPVSLTAYGLILAAGVLAGFCLLYALLPADRRAHFTGLSLSAALGAVIGARVLYCLVNIQQVAADLGFSFAPAFWRGGFSMAGAFLGGGLAAKLFLKEKGLRLRDVSGPLLAAAFLTLAFARAGEAVTPQGLGEYVDAEAALCFFPFAAPDPYGDRYIPVFFWEALAALGGAFFCARAVRRGKEPAVPGVAWLCASQILLESMRKDDCLRFGFTKFNMIFGAVILLVMMLYLLRERKASGNEYALRVPAFLVCAGAMVALEFALDRTLIPDALLYAVMALVLAAMALLAARFRKE